MEHSEALTTNATERYLLEEMTPAERDTFEEHFFDCSECAADVRDGTRMMAAGRAVAAEAPATVHDIRRSPKWLKWIPQAAAIAVVSGGIGWFGAMSYATRNVAATAGVPAIAEVTEHHELLTEMERGPENEQAVEIPLADVIGLDFTIPTHAEAASYVYSVRDASGKPLFSGAKTLEQAADPVELSLRALPRGSYEVVIEGVRKDGNRFPVTRIGFRVV